MSGDEERVPKGYKQTEVGVIPEDWELKTFGEIFDFKSTASNSRSDLTESHLTHYIHYGDIHTVFHRHLNLEKRDTPMISRELCKNAALVRNGDWVMADASEDYSGICKAIEISGITNESSVVAGLHTFLLRDREEIYVNGFKGHLGEAKYLHDQYVRVSVGLKVFGVTKTSLRDLFIPVPSKLEQSRIEEILTDSQSQIQALENLITKKRDIKQGTMQELLTGKTRLPGFTEDWDTISLEEATTIGGLVRGPFGGTLKKSFFVSRGFKVYEQKNAIRQSVEVGDYFIESKKFNELKRFQIEDGDFIVSCSGTIGRIFQIPNNSPPGVINQALLKISINENIVNSDYFLAVFRSLSFQNRILDNSHGGAMPNLVGMPIFRNVIFQIPSERTEQDAIAEILSDMDAEITALELRFEKTKAIKQGMMQQLFTGRIRLVEPSTPVEASA